MNIMIVEDDPVIAKALAQSLKTHHYQTHLFQDFQKVMADFQSFQPHLI